MQNPTLSSSNNILNFQTPPSLSRSFSLQENENSTKKSTSLSSEVPQWQGCNPVLVVQQLKKLAVADIGRNTKIYFTSYPLWGEKDIDNDGLQKVPKNVRVTQSLVLSSN
jgi:hypothetical protein